MNLLHNLPSGPDPPNSVFALVESPSKRRNKFSYDIKREVFVLENVANSPYPVDYGFIPSSWYDDSAPLDVMLIVFEPTFPGCIVRCRPIGLLRIKDENGVDDKILAVPEDEPRFKNVTDVKEIPEHTKKEISHFFEEFKRDVEGSKAELIGWADSGEARRAVEHAINLYKRKFGR